MWRLLGILLILIGFGLTSTVIGQTATKTVVLPTPTPVPAPGSIQLLADTSMKNVRALIHRLARSRGWMDSKFVMILA